MTTAKIIVNPYSGRWRAKAAIPDIERSCQKIGLDYELAVTDTPNHGLELAQKAVEAGFSPIVAAGGDGGISEVVNGLMQAAGAEVAGPLGVIPLGTADDLADMLGLVKDVEAACLDILAGHTRVIDVGCVNGRFFDNNSAVGLEPIVSVAQVAMKRVKGMPRYILAALTPREIKSFALFVVGLTGVYTLAVNPFSPLFFVPLLLWFLIGGRGSAARVLDIVLFALGGLVVYVLFYFFGFAILRNNLAILWYVMMMFSIKMVNFPTAAAITATIAAGLSMIVPPPRRT